MKPTSHTIHNLETLQVLSEPIRFRIFQTVNQLNSRNENCTVKSLAREMDIPHGKLYYHVNMLVEHGLLLVAETRLVSGIVEKFYRAVASEIIVDRNLFSSDKDAAAEARETYALMASGIFKSVITDLENNSAALQASNVFHCIGKETIYLSKSQAQAMEETFLKLLEEFKNHKTTPGEERTPYNFAFAFYQGNSSPNTPEKTP